MKPMKLITTIIAANIAAYGIGCSPKKQNTVAASFKMTGSSSAATVAKNEKPSFWNMLVAQAHALMPTSIQDSSGLTINLTDAWTVVKEVQFKTDETSGAEDSEVEVEFTGPYVVDLLSSAPLILDTQSISDKPIRRIKMQFHKADSLPASAPAGLINNSIYVAGTVGGNSFTFELDDSTEVQIFGPSAFQPSEGSEVLVEIQLANIFKQINMSTITNGEAVSASNRHAGANLCPSIDASANDIYTCVRKGLEKHANLGIDNDHDDDLDGSDSSVK